MGKFLAVVEVIKKLINLGKGLYKMWQEMKKVNEYKRQQRVKKEIEDALKNKDAARASDRLHDL
jgi:hypothetical protein